MLEPIFQTDNYVLARKLLDASVLRQQAIATNIANAETPGFHRLDVAPDFAAQLQAHVNAGDLATRGAAVTPSLTEDQSVRSVRPDGSTVELERELVAMDRNAVDYEYLTQVVTYNLKQLKMAITGKSL